MSAKRPNDFKKHHVDFGDNPKPLLSQFIFQVFRGMQQVLLWLFSFAFFFSVPKITEQAQSRVEERPSRMQAVQEKSFWENKGF